ncbi:hypothetical protein TNCV_4949561 [Trichonephila clavipes]|nr:hypothetical protein TNCV_4949561 [Trichonephila clavipes]
MIAASLTAWGLICLSLSHPIAVPNDMQKAAVRRDSIEAANSPYLALNNEESRQKDSGSLKTEFFSLKRLIVWDICLFHSFAAVL